MTCFIHNSQPDDVVALQCTGGTTGVSKGAMLTHANLLSNCFSFKCWFENYLDDDNPVCLSPLPLYHIFAFTVN